MPNDLAAWLQRLEARHPVAIDLGLERCGEVWARMGAPRPGRRVVTVAGTNGKGSTVAWIDAILRTCGLHTSVYTSPHLMAFNERLRIDDTPADDDAIIEAFSTVESARGDVSLTYFEFTTLACLWLSARAAPDLAILEVGLGGRLDTVNLVDADLAVITAVGLDHQAFLGDDRETIGAEKAGILRAGIPLVCGDSEPPDSVLERAGRLGCPVYLPGREYVLAPIGDGVRYRMGDLELALPPPGLRGEHQYANLGAALTAAAILEPSLGEHGDAIADAVAALRLPGRLYRPPGHADVLVDVGHNPLAAEAVARDLSGTAPVFCVLGMLADKDAEGVAERLAPHVRRWHCAGLAGDRGQSGERLAERVGSALPNAEVDAFTTVGDALGAARTVAEGATVLVFGSFQTAAEALRILGRRAP